VSERAHQPAVPASSEWIHPMSRPPAEWDSQGTHGPGEAQTEVQTRWASDTLISIRDIRELFSLGRTAAYELTHRPGFPEPVKLSPRCYRWWTSEVLAFTLTCASGIRHPAEAARPGGQRIGRRHRTIRRRCVSPGRCASPAAGRHRDTASCSRRMPRTGFTRSTDKGDGCRPVSTTPERASRP
jgi:predicted DNA-binding transcriptional regulator AlpA